MLSQQVATYIRAERLLAGAQGTVLVVGVSGGPDSLALLHLLREIGPRWGVTLHAAHLDHGWRGAAGAADAVWVAEQCAAWGVPCTVQTADVPAWATTQGRSPEDAARQVRYAFLRGVAAQVGARRVAVGHTADDQVETMLLRLLRGTGPAGLAAMRPRRRLGPVPGTADLLALWGLPADTSGPLTLTRPLLHTWRQEIEAYCRLHQLHPRQDATNADPAYTRNRVRQQVVPLLETVAPGFRRRAWALAHDLAAVTEALDAAVDSAWPGLIHENKLNAAGLAALPIAVQDRALRRFYAADAGAGSGLTRPHLAAARRLTRVSAGGRWVQWPGGVALLREGTWLVRLRFDPATGTFDLITDAGRYPLLLGRERIPLVVDGPALRLGPWRVAAWLEDAPEAMYDLATQPTPGGPWSALFDADVVEATPGDAPLLLRVRHPGDRFAPLGLGGHHRRLQDVLTDGGYPRRVRDHLALLARRDGALLWVPGPGGRQSEWAALTPGTRRILAVRFQPD